MITFYRKGKRRQYLQKCLEEASEQISSLLNLAYAHSKPVANRYLLFDTIELLLKRKAKLELELIQC